VSYTPPHEPTFISPASLAAATVTSNAPPPAAQPAGSGLLVKAGADRDEWFFVREGDFKFQVAGEIMRLTAGDSLLVPVNTPHAFVKTSGGIARLIVMHQPAATMEEYFRSVITTADQTVAGRRALAEKHGMRILGDGLKAD
jgi:uncharacterized cupin superfamily protein